MQNGHFRNRAQRVAARFSRKSFLEQVEDIFLSDQAPKKIFLFFVTTVILCVTIEAWNPPFAFKRFAKPERDVACMTPFSLESPTLTNEARLNARFDTPHLYVNDPSKISQFKAELINTVQSLLATESYDKMSDEDRTLWQGFLPSDATPETAAASFKKLQETLADDTDLQSFKTSMDKVFQPYATNGILLKLHVAKEGNQENIRVYDVNSDPSAARDVPAREVLIGNAFAIKDSLNWEFNREIAENLFPWIRSNIKATLTEDKEATVKAQKKAEDDVEPVFSKYETGQIIVRGGEKINPDSFKLLNEEYRVFLSQRSIWAKIVRTFGVFIFIFIAIVLAGFFIHIRQQRVHKKASLATFLTVYGLMIATAICGRLLQVRFANQFGSPEIIPILVFAQGMTIAFSWEIGMITTFIIALSLSLSGSFDLTSFLVLLGILSTVIFLSCDIRRRGQALWAAGVGGITAFVLSLAAGLFQTQDLPHELMTNSALRMFWVVMAGFVMSGLLPIIERAFGILTPMRLLEFGNPSNPLLQELSRKAPATYNHSIQTASIAEAAAEAIGARAALVRVGAYFHDIGKILKPDYFTENQDGFNIHDTLEPRMSTLIIVAHVKDGVDLGKQYALPQPIVELIQQHHGTMLVSFFYEKAKRLSRESNGPELDEGPFRYPGPIPQTKEAGILMLADAVESACRSIGEVSPNRIENLVRQIAEARMEDGQFDESGLTLGEIRTIENSMITSILAMKHSRIKYPGNGNSGGSSRPALSPAIRENQTQMMKKKESAPSSETAGEPKTK